MSEEIACSCCGYPDRELLTPGCSSTLKRVEMGNWVTLKRCPECGQLWCEVPHGSGASYRLAAAWPCTRADFHRLNGLENARILHEWHVAMLRQNLHMLPDPERVGVEELLDGRESEHGVVDYGPWRFNPRFVRRPEDLERYV